MDTRCLLFEPGHRGKCSLSKAKTRAKSPTLSRHIQKKAKNGERRLKFLRSFIIKKASRDRVMLRVPTR